MAAASILGLCAAVASAQVPPFELEPVAVTGSRMPRTLGSEIAATSVLTRADIESHGARDLVSILNLLGTAQVEQQGGPGTAAVVRLRGADSRDTLVLVDGVPLTDVTTGQASLSQIPAEMIERVEVVRGNLSALYGANATGGVIQIFTRRAAPGFAAQLEAGAGSRGTRSASASLAGGSQALRARLGIGRELTNGFSAANPALAPKANPDADGNERSHATLSVDAQLAPAHSLGADLRRIEGTVDYDDTMFGAPTDTHRQRLVQTGGSLRGTHALGARWTLNWRWAETEERRTDTVVSAFGPSFSGNVLHGRGAAVDLDGALSEAWRLQAGIERLSQSTDNATYTQRSRDTDTLRAGATYDVSWGSLQAHLRHDRTSDFGAATTGLAGASVRLGGGFSTMATLSTSYTPPTLDFLYFDCTPFGFVCSNPDLEPERARSIDAALQWQGERTLVRATAFAARYRDKIANAQVDPNDPASPFIPFNLNRAKNEGVELLLRTSLRAWSLVGEATIQHPVDAATGQRLLRRARQQLALRADYRAEGWSAGAGLRYIGERPDVGNTTLASYALVDASASWSLAPDWSLRASVENVFDRRYQPAFGYNGRPRGVFVAASWQPRP